MAGIIAVIAVTTVVVLVLIRAAKQTKEPSDLDLRSVRDAMIEKQGWTDERADAAQFEYVRFLILLQKKPGFMLVPWLDSNGRDDLDQFWHQHILDTEKYSADCKALFGGMIHHNPHVLRGSREEGDAKEKDAPGFTLAPSPRGLMARMPIQLTSAGAQRAPPDPQIRVLIPMPLTLTMAAVTAKVAIVAEEATGTAAVATVVEATDAVAATNRF